MGKSQDTDIDPEDLERASLDDVMPALDAIEGQNADIYQPANNINTYSDGSLCNRFDLLGDSHNQHGLGMARIWCKANSHSIISSIVNLIDSKSLFIFLIKTKGHGNQEADRAVAKSGVGGSSCLNIYRYTTKNLYCDGKICRQFVIDVAWSLNRMHQNLFHDAIQTIEPWLGIVQKEYRN
ncbi:hypothetical protein RCL_jg13990.t1 [Rhizophagus clarus]|uniref:Uncharacterized protein n=1 Tax=Rhizophagus clarus TaxID=94130 RepID=A0A8H3LN76_9GLOM|nr:hypothetical protein RCL_jg13990.t1 [Rhizophagus clarus]